MLVWDNILLCSIKRRICSIKDLEDIDSVTRFSCNSLISVDLNGLNSFTNQCISGMIEIDLSTFIENNAKPLLDLCKVVEGWRDLDLKSLLL